MAKRPRPQKNPPKVRERGYLRKFIEERAPHWEKKSDKFLERRRAASEDIGNFLIDRMSITKEQKEFLREHEKTLFLENKISVVPKWRRGSPLTVQFLRRIYQQQINDYEMLWKLKNISKAKKIKLQKSCKGALKNLEKYPPDRVLKIEHHSWLGLTANATKLYQDIAEILLGNRFRLFLRQRRRIMNILFNREDNLPSAKASLIDPSWN